MTEDFRIQWERMIEYTHIGELEIAVEIANWIWRTYA